MAKKSMPKGVEHPPKNAPGAKPPPFMKGGKPKKSGGKRGC